VLATAGIVYGLNRSEAVAILVALASLTIAWISPYFGSPYYIAVSTGIIVLSVLLHELAHRQVARRLGCYSRFILDPMGLAITLVSAALPVKFLAPGYVGISCPFYRVPRYAEVRIAGAGPLTNLLLSSIAVMIRGIYFSHILGDLALLNAWLALFNLLPIGPLDGAKVFHSSRQVWLAMFAWAALLMYLA